jgi:hypothetical protein
VISDSAASVQFALSNRKAGASPVAFAMIPVHKAGCLDPERSPGRRSAGGGAVADAAA